MGNSPAKQINVEFRLLTVLGIIFVICGHYGIGSLTLDWLYPYDCFHIPMFMFISGYFFNKKSIESIKSLSNYVKKGISFAASILRMEHHLRGDRIYSCLPWLYACIKCSFFIVYTFCSTVFIVRGVWI